MTTESSRDLQPRDLTDEAVEFYLCQHPDFFERKPALLTSLKLPHPTGGAVSLIERQVELLRSKNRQLERKLMALVQVARDNEGLSTRLHRLALGLMEAESLDDVLATTKELLLSEFPSTTIAIRLLASLPEAAGRPEVMHLDSPGAALLDQLLECKRPLCGALKEDEKWFVFGPAAKEVISAVITPLSDGRKFGLLGLGSARAGRFKAGMGTLFLDYLAELVSRAIREQLT